MLRTTDGRSMTDIFNELNNIKPDMNNINKVLMSFDIDGSTSSYHGHDEETIHVEITDIYVKLSGGGNTIKLPNYNWPTLKYMIERAIEILFFEYGIINNSGC